MSGAALALLAAAATTHWTVAHVRIDPALDNLEQRWFADDPRLLGREVTIARDRLAIDDGGGACTAVRRTTVRQTPAAALASRLYRRQRYLRRHPTPADMGLAAGRAPVAVTRFGCGGAGAAEGGHWSGTLAFALPRGRLALLWSSEVVLELVPARGPPRPSFACARAATPSERAICGDRSLAGWDRSVAAALAVARQGNADLEPADDDRAWPETQRAWLRTRDRCGADRTCLSEAMQARTDALMRR
jgi:uncharacterized protein YecT (DUF1311 family)